PFYDLVKKGVFGAVSLVGDAIWSLPGFLGSVHPPRFPCVGGGPPDYQAQEFNTVRYSQESCGD
ncbi:MAG: hypothetical protein ACI9VI_003308, partial [Candidatus Azotimanducaceae bacterium]